MCVKGLIASYNVHRNVSFSISYLSKFARSKLKHFSFVLCHYYSS